MLMLLPGVARRMMGHAVRTNHLEDPIALLVVDPHIGLSTHGLCRGQASDPDSRSKPMPRLRGDPGGGALLHGSLGAGWLGRARDSVRSSHHHQGDPLGSLLMLAEA